MRYISLIIILFATITVQSQKLVISGYVYDAKTGQALPQACISILENMGTVTNSEGLFSFKLSNEVKFPLDIVISYIGYENLRASVANLKTQKYFLEPKPLSIPEVIVKYDFIYSILKQAYEKISENYPEVGTRYEGFMRQTLLRDDRIVYIGEAVMDSYRSSYKSKGADDQIKILKFRKFSGSNNFEDSLWIVGSPFIFYSVDYVKLRKKFLNPKYYDEFEYTYNKVVSYLGDDHYEFQFKDKSGFLKGKMLINKKNFAYSNIIIENNFKMQDGGYIIEKGKSNVSYSRGSGSYYLKHFSTDTYFKSIETNNNFKVNIVYAVNEFKPENADPIPFNESISFSNVLMNNNIDTTKSFWKNYNIIEGDSSINKFIVQKHRPSKYDRLKVFLNKTKNFNFELGMGGHQFKSAVFSNNIQLIQQNGVMVNNPIAYKNDPAIFAYFSVGYQINKRIRLNYTLAKDKFSSPKYVCRDISLDCRGRIKNFGKPTFIMAELGISWFDYRRNIAIEEETILFQNNKLNYSGLKGTNLFFATGFTAFLNYSFAISLKVQMSYMTNYSPLFKYKQENSTDNYYLQNTKSINFSDRLNTRISIGLSYFLNRF